MALVRHDYSNEAVWRKALGNKEPLYPFAIHGEILDAPQRIPAGAHKSTIYGPQHVTVDREQP